MVIVTTTRMAAIVAALMLGLVAMDRTGPAVVADGAGDLATAPATAAPPESGLRIVVPHLQSDGPAPPPPPPEPASVFPASAEGLRVWSNGDSTSYFMTLWFLQLMEERGAVATHKADYVISSGLNSPGYFNWPAYLQSEMARAKPDVVVFMVGANDARVGMDLAAYRSRVAAVMDLLEAPGRAVIWVGQPAMSPVKRRDLYAAIPPMNAVFAEEAAKRPWVRFVDTWALTVDAHGAYASVLPDNGGVPREMRAGDGVHLTSAGGRHLALGVIDVLFGP